MKLISWMVRSNLLVGLPRIRYRVVVVIGWLARMGLVRHERWGVSPTGHRLMCDLRDPMQARIFLLGAYSESEIENLRRDLHPGGVLVDVGANIGLFSIELAGAVSPGGEIWAFEPAPDTAERLKGNVAANKLGGVISVMEMALGDAQGELPLTAPADDRFDTGRRMLGGGGQTIGVVRVMVFDELVRNGTLDLRSGLHAVKVDVEGAELGVLKGMRETLELHRPRIVMVETIDDHLAAFGTSTEGVDAFMRSIGYDRESPSGALNSVYRPRPEGVSKRPPERS